MVNNLSFCQQLIVVGMPFIVCLYCHSISFIHSSRCHNNQSVSIIIIATYTYINVVELKSRRRRKTNNNQNIPKNDIHLTFYTQWDCWKEIITYYILKWKMSKTERMWSRKKLKNVPCIIVIIIISIQKMLLSQPEHAACLSLILKSKSRPSICISNSVEFSGAFLFSIYTLS